MHFSSAPGSEGTDRNIDSLFFVCICSFDYCGLFPQKRRNPSAGSVGGDETLVNHLREPWTGDLDEILKQRRVVRVLVYYSKTNFAIVEGRPQGLEYELLHNYQNFLDKKGGRGKVVPLVVFIPVPREQIIPLLLEGRGDIATGLTITPQSEKLVAFTVPYITDVRGVIVTGKGVSGLRSLGDLAGRTVHVAAGSGYAEQLRELYGFDWLKITAMAYQESQLDQNVRGRGGAVGILQVLPVAAAEVGIRNVARTEDNIHAGVKYLNYLRETYFNDPGISPDDKVDFALAAYNAGPARIESLRRKAADMGLNPNKWFFNVERAALRVSGRTTVLYVAAIYKYYIAYKSADRIIQEKHIKLQKAGKDL